MANEKQKAESREVYSVYNKIPYALINAEAEGSAKDVLEEFAEIKKYYDVYYKGQKFVTEGSNGDYVPAQLKYKLAANLINKEARFLFAESPDINVEAKGDLGGMSEQIKKDLLVLNDLVTTVLEKNNFENKLLKATKDCFIGKRVAGLVNWNEEDGITITFLPSTQFIYETKLGSDDIIQKFVAFILVRDSKKLKDKRIFKKKYEMEDGVVYLIETLYDGAGTIIEETTPRTKLDIDFIPVKIFINDGLTGDIKGESEIAQIRDFEEYYSKLSNADIDSERKNMNPIKYTVDMDSRSTEGLSSSAGAHWDLGSDQNLEKANPMVGTLESSMNYSGALKDTLARIKTAGYEVVDVPDITLETTKGVITSGKALKTLYWPLIVRCKEKMKMWGPQLAGLIDILIQGSLIYPNCVQRYITNPIPSIAYQISIVQNIPIPEDEESEKNIDLSEVESKTMSRKAYMKKWRGLTDKEIQDELEQIAAERQMLEDTSFGGEPIIPDLGQLEDDLSEDE